MRGGDVSGQPLYLSNPGKKVAGAKEVAYLKPQAGARTLILQTCWPPGTYYKRMLIFADLIDVQEKKGFDEVVLLR